MKFAVFLAALSTLSAQNQPTFNVETKLVRLLVNVKDTSGKLVGSLERDQFTVYDCGVRQEISFFERYTTRPLSVALLVDTSGSTRKDWASETRSLKRFLDALFKEGNERDTAALYTFNYDIIAQSNFIRDARRLEERLRGIRPEGGTSLYDAIHFAATDLQSRDGRHVIVLVSDGGNTTSSKAFQDAREAAQRADAVMYPIVIVPITNDAGRNLGGEHALETLAADTGGRWFDPTIGDALDKTFTEILRDLRAQYMIGYYPRNLKDAPQFHTVHVDVKREDLQAQTRTGYYGNESH